MSIVVAPRPVLWPTRILRPRLLLPAAVLTLVVSWAVLPGAFATHDPLLGVPAETFRAPSTDHWMGTDNLGRDLYSRVVHGASLSLRTAMLAVLVSVSVGALLGLVAGYIGGLADSLIMRLVDVVMAVPGLLLAMAFIAVLGFGSTNVAVAVGLAGTSGFARVMRAEVMRVRSSEYVEAARGCGQRTSALLIRHVVPNAVGPVVALAVVEFGTALLAVSALSFLGFGTAPPAPEWGNLVAEGRNYMTVAGWMTTMPGLVIVGVVLAVNRMARAVEREGDQS